MIELDQRHLALLLVVNSSYCDGCLTWAGTRRTLDIDGVRWRVQDLAWVLANGIPVTWRKIGSYCGTPDCIRPDHLRNVTPSPLPHQEHLLPRRVVPQLVA